MRWNADQSSAELALHFGVTRSAIIGKIFRLRNSGVPLRTERPATATLRANVRHKIERRHAGPRRMRYPAAKPSAFRSALIKKLQTEAEAAHKAAALPRVADVGRKVLVALGEDECKWPCGPGDPHLFCAAPRVPAMPYCLAHCERAYAVPHAELRQLLPRPEATSPVASKYILESVDD